MKFPGELQRWILSQPGGVVSVAEIMDGYFGFRRGKDGLWEGDKKARILARTVLGHSIEALRQRGFVRFVRPNRTISAVVLTDAALELRKTLIPNERR